MINFCDFQGQALTYSNWQPKEPNNQGNEDCVHMVTYAGGKWNDVACNTKIINVFCEVLIPQGDGLKL